MGLICKPRPTAKEATRVSGPGNMVVYHASVSAEGLEEAIECVRGRSAAWSQRVLSMAWVSHGKGLTSLRQQLKS